MYFFEIAAFWLLGCRLSGFAFSKLNLSSTEKKGILRFFLLTAFYELVQIVCNNSDILMVKHYFDSYDAGLYSSLALIGRIVYFVTWMFVMLLLPAVIELRKEDQDPVPVLKKYLDTSPLMQKTPSIILI